MEKLFEIVEESGNISTQAYTIEKEGKKFTIIEASMRDKYGQERNAH